MRILQVVNLFGVRHGGSAIVPYYLSKELASRGHQVSIYTSNFKISLDSLPIIAGVKIKPFKSWFTPLGFPVTPSMILANDRYDVIHMHNYRTFQNIVAHHYAKKHNIPYILQAHGSFETFFQKGQLKKVFDAIWGNKILRDASMTIASTKAEAEQCKGIDNGKVKVIPNGINLPEFDNLPPRGKFRRKHDLTNQKIILYLGRIHKIKGLDLLVRTFADISKHTNDVKLVIVGSDDGYLSHLKKLVADLEISDRVLFTGALYGREKLEAYVDADVYVQPSYYETFPIAVLESCACGTPVIVSKSCGLAGEILGQAGLVFSYNKEQLQHALLMILLSSDKLRLRLGEGGKLLVRDKLNWEKIAEQIESIYSEVLTD